MLASPLGKPFTAIEPPTRSVRPKLRHSFLGNVVKHSSQTRYIGAKADNRSGGIFV
jgi:hypothetical protein